MPFSFSLLRLVWRMSDDERKRKNGRKKKWEINNKNWTLFASHIVFPMTRPTSGELVPPLCALYFTIVLFFLSICSSQTLHPCDRRETMVGVFSASSKTIKKRKTSAQRRKSWKRQALLLLLVSIFTVRTREKTKKRKRSMLTCSRNRLPLSRRHCRSRRQRRRHSSPPLLRISTS